VRTALCDANCAYCQVDTSFANAQATCAYCKDGFTYDSANGVCVRVSTKCLTGEFLRLNNVTHPCASCELES
jgi:hypothetical protein